MLFGFGGIFRKVWRGALVLGTFILGASSLFSAPVSAAAGINQQLNFQGRLLNAQGATAPDGFYNVQFKIYQDGVGTTAGNPGGSLKWTENWLNSEGHGVQVKNGYISVQLGSVTPFGTSVDWNQDTLWLSINIGNTNLSCTPFTSCTPDGEMLPMKRLSAVPYALNAGSLNGKTSADFIQNTTSPQTATMWITGSIRSDTSVLTPILDTATAATLSIGATNATGITIGKAGVTTTIVGDLHVANIDTDTATTLNIGTANSTGINLNQNTVIAAGKSLTITGGTTGTRPASPTEGMVYYDTDTKQLITYSNGKWQGDRSDTTKIVAASNSSQAAKDAADYVASGTSDQTTINTALSVAAGGKVYLMEGTYSIDDRIQIPNNTTLAGAGRNTLIQLGNLAGASKNMIENTDQGGTTGEAVVVRDLRLDGNNSVNTTGTIYGIYMNNLNGSSGASARSGAIIANVWITNMKSEGIRFNTSPNGSVTNTTIQGGMSNGIYLSSSNRIEISNNTIQGNSGSGIGLAGSVNVTVTSNVLITNGTSGISLNGNSNNNTISANNLANNGGSGANNSITLSSVNNNQIIGNSIVDNGGTGAAIGIDSASAANYLSNNVFNGTGATSINDASTTTVYASQSRAASGGQITNRTANDGQAFTVQNASGANIFAVDTTNSQIVVGNSSTAGKLTISDGSSNTATIVVGALAGNYTYTIPTTTANDTFCLVSLGNCAADGTLFIQNQNTAAQAANYWINGTARADTSVLTPIVDTTGAALSIGTANASGVTIGRTSTVTTINGKLGVTLDTTTGTTITCRNTTGYLSVCDSSVLTPSGENFIQNQSGSMQTGANFWIDGLGRAAGGLQSGSLDTITAGPLSIGATNANLISIGKAGVNTTIQGNLRANNLDTPSAGTLTIGGTNATGIALSQNVAVAAGKSLTLTGGNTASRPASPTEGMVYYDTDTKQLLTYANGKWQADRNTATKIVAASNASQAAKDGADYVTDGTGDQVEINDALTAAAGGKVYLTEGTFTLSGAIQVRNNTTLAGAGGGTIITVPNAQNGTYNMVTNYDTSTGTNIVIQDLKIDGNKANQTGGSMGGIYFDHVGGSSGTTARPGGKISNVTVTNTYAGTGILLSLSNHNIITSTTVLGAGGSGIRLTNSGYNTLDSNFLQGSSTAGIYFDANSYRNTASNNSVQVNSFAGIYLYNSNDNIVTDNNISDSGTAANNNAIYLDGTSARTSVTNNTIVDVSATSNYAINIGSSAVSTLLSNNLFSSTPGTSTINDASSNTIYSNQSRSENGGRLTNRTTNNAEAFVVQNASGSNLFAVDTANNQVVIGNTATGGKLVLSDGSSNTGTIAVGSLDGNYTYTIPTTTSDDTFCLVALANCANETMFIQNQNTAPQTANSWIDGTARADTSVLTPLIDTATATALNIGTTNASVINLNQNVTVAAGKSLALAGGTTASRPSSPTEGMLWYDTTTKQLLAYSNGKWQSDRSTSTKIVAASNASQALKDGADYVATGTGDQSTINTALTAATGGKVYLTEGTYTINGSISIPNDTTLAGAGRGTIITIPNSHNTNINAVTNTTTGGSGTGIVIQDLRLEGNRTNQASGTMYGIYLNGVGSNSTAGSAVQGARVANVWSNNWLNNGIFLITTYSTTITSTTVQNNGAINILLNNSGYNTVSNSTTLSGTYGIYQNGTSSHNNFSGNTVMGSIVAGIYLGATTSNTIVANNKIHDNGSSTVNNGVYLVSSSSNTITGNAITDSSATTNYAINITDSASNSNYLANNTLGTGSINDLGTGTVYAGQFYNSTNFRIQPATNITVGNGSTTTTIQGSLSITPQTSTSTTLLCSNGGIVSTCDSSVLAPTQSNFIRNQNSSAQAASSWINGTARADTSILSPILDTATGATLNIGTTTATGITIGRTTTATTVQGTLQANTIDAISATTLSIGATTASGLSIGKSSGTTTINSNTITVGSPSGTTTIAGAAQTTNNTDGSSLAIMGSAGLGTGKGGTVTIQGGNAGATSGANGGNLVLSGGTGSGTGVSGLVVINNATYSTATIQSSATSVNVTQANIDAFGAIILSATASDVNFTLSSPSLGANAAGRVIYVTAANGSQDFTLRANVGGGTGVEQNIAMRQNTTATMIWNGSQWTAAGASSSTTLQAAYDNTLQSAGGAELVVSKTSATNGLTIRDSAINPVNGTLLSVQTSSAAGLLSVNSNVTEYATNAGAETAGSTQTTFPSNTWFALSGANVARYVTAGDYIATGKASVSAATNTTAGSGMRNRLSTQLSPNMTYNVSFTTRLLSGTFTDLEVYYSINGTAASVPCTTGKAAATSIWTKVNCTFTAPASGITADNSVFIRQTGSGTSRTFYVDNLSVTIAADFNYATDGSVTDGDNFTTNWLFGGLGSGSITRNLTDGQDASDSAQVTLTTGAANAGIRNKLSLNPLPNTLYRITVYAKVSSGTFNDFKVRYSPDGSTTAGGNYIDCKDYNTRSLSTTAWTRITCFIQTDGTTATNPHVYFVEEASAARTFRVDAFTMTLTTNTAPNVQIGGGENGGPTTLLTLDKAASAPIAINNDALLGSMYYDTTLGKLQCYEADGWGACGSSPDTIVTISPEFTNAVLHGTGVGTMVSDLCSDTLNINDGSSGQPNICGTNETYNFYKWTSPQPSAQTYGVYVTYQLPASFKSFESGSTSIMGRTDSTSSTIEYQVYRNDAATGLIACGPTVTVSSGAAGSWQPGVATGTSDPSTCGFAPGNSIVFRINVTASQNANAYIGNLNFIFSNR